MSKLQSSEAVKNGWVLQVMAINHKQKKNHLTT